MNNIINQQPILDIILTYTGEDGLNRHRRVFAMHIGEETLGFQKYNGEVLPPLDKIVCKDVYELEIFVTIHSESEIPNIHSQRWKYSEKTHAWYQYFKLTIDQKHDQSVLEQLKLISNIKSDLIKRLFCDR